MRKEEIETIALKVDKLRIPLEQAWREAGYSQDEIDAMMSSEEYQARRELQLMAGQMFGRQDDNE